MLKIEQIAAAVERLEAEGLARQAWNNSPAERGHRRR